jgi:LPPG:FO 2-phospho-L-lactate transferase
MKVVALAGGTGSAKLLRGLNQVVSDLTVLANVGDNIWMYGVYVCPDIDVACYSLAGISDQKKGWGVADDTFRVLQALRRVGVEAWFTLGDRDLATCLARTEMIRSGRTLTEATEAEALSLGLRPRVLPVTDDPLETRILTSRGDIHLQEFWVRDGGKPEVKGVRYKGASRAQVSRLAAAAVSAADLVVVCPANPVTSIGPMLAVPGFRRLLANSRARKVALSPMEGLAPFSGPAGKLLKAIRTRPDSAGVAGLYRSFLDTFLISKNDSNLVSAVEACGVRCVLTDTQMTSAEAEVRLAKEVLRR